MSATTTEWPEPLKKWVARCLAQMTESNRAEASAELKMIIAEAYAKKDLHRDWDAIQLKSLQPSIPTLGLKRKLPDQPPKKAKKAAIAKQSFTNYGTETGVTLEQRKQRFAREHEIERQKTGGNVVRRPGGSLASRMYNSADAYSANDTLVEPDPLVIDWDADTIVGTSTAVFKDYLRLTSAPEPRDIRPYNVLQRTLAELKQRWKREQNYPWICNQFKSLRQDLTVQRIKNDFTVQVYEIHARMALEAIDLVEFNQCQATLKTLYELGIQGKRDEFTAYRILSLLHGRNRSELNILVSELTSDEKASKSVRHALDVNKSMISGNYCTFFRLFQNAPNMGGYIMDHFIERERLRALATISKAYLTVSVSYLCEVLALESPSATIQLLQSILTVKFMNPLSLDKDKIVELKGQHNVLMQIYGERYRKVGIKGSI